MTSVKILADSLNLSGNRLTTFELTFPRVILAEFNTHRMISRNAASSRAIPTEKLIQRVLDEAKASLAKLDELERIMKIPEMREQADALLKELIIAHAEREPILRAWAAAQARTRL